jgi:hypothetical protein
MHATPRLAVSRDEALVFYNRLQPLTGFSRGKCKGGKREIPGKYRGFVRSFVSEDRCSIQLSYGRIGPAHGPHFVECHQSHCHPTTPAGSGKLAKPNKPYLELPLTPIPPAEG